VHCIVSSGRSTRCNELVEIHTSRRQRSASSVGRAASPERSDGTRTARLRTRRRGRKQSRIRVNPRAQNPWQKETCMERAYPRSTAANMGSMHGWWTRASVSSACSSFDFRLLRMQVRSSQSSPVKRAPSFDVSSVVARCRARAVSADAGLEPVMWARTASSTTSKPSNVGSARSACFASKGSSRPAMRVEAIIRVTTPSSGLRVLRRARRPRRKTLVLSRIHRSKMATVKM
jgi:hypothetical protein